MRLEDPVATCTNRSQYLSFIRTLRTFFDTDFQIRDVETRPPAEIVVRCGRYLANVGLIMCRCSPYALLCRTSKMLHLDLCFTHLRGNLRRWTKLMRAKFLPWRPTVTLTGTAYYSVDCSGVTGQIMSRRDEWDAVDNSSYFSVRQAAFQCRCANTIHSLQQCAAYRLLDCTALRLFC